MKSVLLFLLFFTLNTGHQQSPQAENEPFAVVELFASEGCSSCPSAETFFHDEMQSQHATNVLFLAFHINYFNGPLPGPCGTSAWDDRFSDPQFTVHQEFYKARLKSQYLLTPQFIFNGEKCTYSGAADFTVSYQNDSMRSVYQSFLHRKPEQKPKTSLELKRLVVDTNGRKVKVGFSANQLPPESRVLVFLLESHLVSKITAGENCGKTLKHDNVVRQMSIFPNQEKGSGSIIVPDDAVLRNLHLATYAQNTETGEIVAIDKGFALFE